MLLELVGHEGRITRCAWGPLNRTLLSAGEDGSVRLWDVEVRSRARRRAPWRERRVLAWAARSRAPPPLLQTGKQLAETREHKKQVNDLTMSAGSRSSSMARCLRCAPTSRHHASSSSDRMTATPIARGSAAAERAAG